jgi:hypothetical protein
MHVPIVNWGEVLKYGSMFVGFIKGAYDLFEKFKKWRNERIDRLDSKRGRSRWFLRKHRV